MTFADTSFLLPLYVEEEQTEVAQKYMAQAGEGLTYTPFHRLELRTALRLRVFRGTITSDFMKRVFQLIEADLRDGILKPKSFNWPDALRQAEEIAEAHLIQVGARSVDLLHVASAVVLGATEFCTFDRRQGELARRAGLKVAGFR